MKYYHMIIEQESPKNPDKPERREYISPRQGAAPAGWKCVGVCGYHEEPKNKRSNKED